MTLESAAPPRHVDGRPHDGRTHVSVREARRRIAEWLNRASFGAERIVVERHGKPIAAIVCVEDLEYLEAADDELDKKMLADLDRDRAAARRRAKAKATRRRRPAG